MGHATSDALRESESSTGSGSGLLVGLDVGGTNLKGALVDRDGRVIARLHEPIRRDSAEALLAQLADAVVRLGHGQLVAAVGMGLPGIIDRAGERVRNAPNLTLLNGLHLGEDITRRTGHPAFAENDANAAALAEAWRGAGRGAASLLFVTLGTGVGGAIVLDGKVWQGRSGYAGEIGHVQVDPQGIPCGCGSWGCLETVAGIGGWIRRAEAAAAARPSRLRAGAIDPEVIVAAAREGDELALEIVNGSAAAIAVGVSAAANLLNLERVVIGGGVAQAGAFLLDRIVEECRRRLFAHVFADVTFALAELGGDAGVVGAARVGMLGAAAPRG